MDMIERVAKAVYEKWESYPAYATQQMNGLLAEDLARAAIEAMRIPTTEMSETVQLKHTPHQGGVSVVWMDMIDAALSSSREPKANGSPDSLPSNME